MHTVPMQLEVLALPIRASTISSAKSVNVIIPGLRTAAQRVHCGVQAAGLQSPAET